MAQDVKTIDCTSAEMFASQDDIQSKIFTLRGVQVMLDRDLAILYQVETKHLNRAVKRNIERFPNDFMFQLNRDEFKLLRCQNVTSKDSRGGADELISRL